MRKILISFLATLMVINLGLSVARADDATMTRDQIVNEMNTKYYPQFDAIKQDLLALKEQSKSITTLASSVEFVLKDYLEVRATIDGSVQSPTADVSSVIGYSEEEIGELTIDVQNLKARLAKVKTIKCVKGKTVKTLKVEKVKCPAGFTLKK